MGQLARVFCEETTKVSFEAVGFRYSPLSVSSILLEKVFKFQSERIEVTVTALFITVPDKKDVSPPPAENALS
jgi:molecular chaperone DnaK (HSP70)